MFNRTRGSDSQSGIFIDGRHSRLKSIRYLSLRDLKRLVIETFETTPIATQCLLTRRFFLGAKGKHKMIHLYPVKPVNCN